MVPLFRADDLVPEPGRSPRFEGHAHGASVSFFVSRVAAGRGPDLPHKFTAGSDGLRSVNIRGSSRMIQEDLPDDG
jgi:hypothetical protein